MSSIIAKRKVLITGGAGFIGSNLVKKLLNLNFRVNLILKKSTNLWRIKDVLSKTTIHQVSLLDKQALLKTVKKINPQVIIHLATYAQYRNQQDSRQMIETNINGTLNLLTASKDINYDIFINTGSSSEYGIKESPMKEIDVLSPISFYAMTKASATLLCQVFSREYKKPIVTLRPFSVYGYYEEQNRFIPTIMKALIEKKTINLTSGKQRRDFIYIDDIIDIYLRVLQKGENLSGKILNMGTGKEYTNDEVVEILFKVTGEKTKVNKGSFPKRLWDTPHWVADINFIQKMLKWKPKYSLQEGLKKTYEWYKNEAF